MKSKMKFLMLLFLFWGIMANGCSENSSDKDEIVPCNDLQSDSVVEINNLQTKLYFINSYPDDAIRPMVPFNKEGLRYNLPNKTAVFVYEDPKGTTNTYTVCNFPDYAIGWNPKYWDGASYDVIVEGEVNVVISGKGHIFFPKTEDESQNNLGLTSLIKK